MGRRYNGDIDGKFAFAIQGSDCADRFGVEGYESTLLHYHFEKENLESVEKELSKIEKGKDFKLIKEFFEKNEMYNDKQIADLLNKNKKQAKDSLREYFDYEMGCKIRDSIKKTGSCYFEAETE